MSMAHRISQIESGIMPYGRHKGKRFEDIDSSYLQWLATLDPARKDNEAVRDQAKLELQNRNMAEDDSRPEEFAGAEGERLVFFVRVNRQYTSTGQWGATYTNICSDREGHVIVYKGSAKWTVGNYYLVKASVVKNLESSAWGKYVTMISRPTVSKVVDKDGAEIKEL